MLNVSSEIIRPRKNAHSKRGTGLPTPTISYTKDDQISKIINSPQNNEFAIGFTNFNDNRIA